MRTQLAVCAFLAICLAATAQTKIKGHRLGESPSEFLKSDAPLAIKLQECHQDAPHALTAEQVHSLPDDEISAIALHYPNFPNRKKLEKLAASSVVMSSDKRFPGRQVFCDAAIAVLEDGKDGRFLSDIYFPDISVPNTQFVFWKGSLSEIDLDLFHVEFADVSADFEQKVGMKPVETQPQMQNGMGAVWLDRVAVWTTPELHAVLHESRNPAKPELSFVIKSTALRSVEAAEKTSRPSALD
ncbi:hypothetical protein [Granulicella aggregans]|uniref:hypothetical protein n=1 Tax=Granulicella aggregans TaxID=474949 RepID=UPI0021E06434|nr:hypothetical protein [Granulicella aggregans]